MSAPYIIPFNFQPVSTVASSSGTYTVPAGKYAKVTIENAILPVLNSNNLYSTKTYSGVKQIPNQPATRVLSAGVNNAHRFAVTTINNYVYCFNFSVATAVYNETDFYTPSSFGTYSHTFSAPADLTVISSTCGAAANISSYSIDFCNIREIWLKAGDVFTYSAGSILYTEYNVIS